MIPNGSVPCLLCPRVVVLCACDSRSWLSDRLCVRFWKQIRRQLFGKIGCALGVVRKVSWIQNDRCTYTRSLQSDAVSMIYVHVSAVVPVTTYRNHLLAGTTRSQEYNFCQVIIHTAQLLRLISVLPAILKPSVPTCTGGSLLLVLAFEVARFLPMMSVSLSLRSFCWKWHVTVGDRRYVLGNFGLFR